jgi:flavin-dependent dehydrogenase
MVDVLVVGARCAGATLGIFLARKGKRVLVVDMDDMPSDQPMSTHFIGVHGMSILDELGIASKVHAFSPPVPRFINGVEDAVACIDFAEGRRGTCPRRTELDALLVDEARAAGAEVALKTKLVELCREGGRVVGAIVERDGQREEVRCSVVVGADGRHSKVADLVGAKEYKGYDTPRGAYWAYWKRPTWYSDDPRYRGAAAILHVGDEFRLIFPTNTDQLLIGIAFPIEKVDEWKGRQREVYIERLRAWKFTAPLTEGEPLSKVIGFVKGRFFFREATGPGWALVGDAGLFKDPSPGLGITDAFRDAKALSTALVAGTDEALVKYWRERDVASLELFEFAKNMGMPGYNNPLNHVVFEQLAKRPDLRARIVKVQERSISPFAAFTLRQIVGWTLREVLRGRLGIVRPFLDAGKRGKEIAKELEAWKELAREAAVSAARANASASANKSTPAGAGASKQTVDGAHA